MATETQNTVWDDILNGKKRTNIDGTWTGEDIDGLPEEVDMTSYQADYDMSDFQAPSSNIFSDAWNGASDFLGKAFSTGDKNGITSSDVGKSTGSWDLKGMGSIAQGIGSIWDAYNKKEYQDEMVGMEKARVAREVDKQTKAQKAFDSAWA